MSVQFLYFETASKLLLCCKSIAYCFGMDVAFRKCGYNVKIWIGKYQKKYE